MKPDLSPNGVEKWFNKLANAKEKLTKLHFFFHDVVSGATPTAVEIARAATATSFSRTFFGLMRVYDDLLTETGSPNSKKLGYGQGTYTLASQRDVRILFTFTFVFTEGEYAGSTLSVLGSNPIDHQYREMPIVGGSGVFRLAKGSAVASTHWRNISNHDGIVEFTLFVLHYENEGCNEDEGMCGGPGGDIWPTYHYDEDRWNNRPEWMHG